MAKSILEVIHEGAQDLRKAGVMDDVTLREFDALCLPAVRKYTPAEIKRIRLRTRTSQGVFAHYLNTSIYTVQKREQGSNKPNRPSMKLLDIVDRKGLDGLT